MMFDVSCFRQVSSERYCIMNSKIKLACAALLGFAAACSGVKNAPAKGLDDPTQTADSLSGTDTTAHMRAVVMYGVRVPGGSLNGLKSVPSVQLEQREQSKKEARKLRKAEQRRQNERATPDNYDPSNMEAEEPDYE